MLHEKYDKKCKNMHEVSGKNEGSRESGALDFIQARQGSCAASLPTFKSMTERLLFDTVSVPAVGEITKAPVFAFAAICDDS